MNRFTFMLLFWLGNVAPSVRFWTGLALGALLLLWMLTLTP